MDLFDQLEYILWYPGIGDPSIPGRLTVIVYLGTAILCLACGLDKPAKPVDNSRHRWFWLSLAGTLFSLGLVKQYNLFSRLTSTLSQLAWQSDWYTSRGVIQLVFILLIGLLLLMMVVVVLNQGWRDYRLPMIAFGFLLFLVFVRATSFHYIDLLLNLRLVGIKMNWILEYSSIVCIGVAALLTLNLQRHSKQENLALKQTTGS